MTRPRSATMHCTQIEIHHLFTRNVQRAMFCGYDSLTGRDYSYRRDIIYELIRYLADVLSA